jgi:hypothetical protein
VVLSENELEEWEFRKSMNPNASEHNHDMMAPDEMVKAWPVEVNDMIIQLARQRLQTHEIREAVKQHFPDITWNERRFYNRLTEERKRIRQRGVVERSQRLLLLSARLCSIVAANNEWTIYVESELQRLFENFCQLARLTPENINTLVDLQTDLIQLESLLSNTYRLSITNDGSRASNDDDILESPAKKRRSFARASSTSSASTGAPDSQKGIQMVYVPSYTLQIRSHIIRPSSDPMSSSSGHPGRHGYPEPPFNENGGGGGGGGGGSGSHDAHLQQRQQQQQQQHGHHQHGQQQAFGNSSSLFSLASPTSSSSSSSSIPFQRQHSIAQPGVPPPSQQQPQRVTSPQQSIHSPNGFIMSQSYHTPQPQQGNNNNTSNTNNNSNSNNSNSGDYGMTNTAGIPYNLQTSFSPYNIPSSTFTSPSELPFSFDSANQMMPMRGGNAERTEAQPERRQQVYGFFPNNVKEEPSNVDMLQRQQEYEQSNYRTFSQQQNYSLPMIRANEDPEETNWA